MLQSQIIGPIYTKFLLHQSSFLAYANTQVNFLGKQYFGSSSSNLYWSQSLFSFQCPLKIPKTHAQTQDRCNIHNKIIFPKTHYSSTHLQPERYKTICAISKIKKVHTSASSFQVRMQILYKLNLLLSWLMRGPSLPLDI